MKVIRSLSAVTSASNQRRMREHKILEPKLTDIVGFPVRGAFLYVQTWFRFTTVQCHLLQQLQTETNGCLSGMLASVSLRSHGVVLGLWVGQWSQQTSVNLSFSNPQSGC